MSSLEALRPGDGHDQALLSLVRPPGHRNPEPARRYNLVVIGAGTAGLVAAAGAAGLGARVALVERALMGGDCLNAGCVPSKALLASGRAWDAVRSASGLGIRVPSGASADFGAAMERMRRLRSGIGRHDSVERFRSLGVDVFLGQAVFQDRSTARVGEALLRFSRAAICTGARPALPPVPGLDSVPVLTSGNLFSLQRRPDRLGILGAGAIGCEMAQAFARLGSRVELFASGRGLLPEEDREAAALVKEALEQDGVRIHDSARRLSVSSGPGGVRLADSRDGRTAATVDRLLVAAGRVPNVEGLGLERAGVGSSARGVAIDDFLRTANPRIYAAGDCCSPVRHTHAADFMARALIRNALFMGRVRLSGLLVPRCTYTSPEVAHAGLSPRECLARGLPSLVQPFSEVDRAILDGSDLGWVKVHHRPGSGRILSATVAAPGAGDLIGHLATAMKAGMGLSSLAGVIMPYPTRAEAIRKLGDQYQRSRLTPRVRSLLGRWLSWRRL